MAISRREAALLAGGLVLGLAGAWAVFGRGDGAAPPVNVAKPEAGRSAPAAAAPTKVASADLCSFDRVVAPSGDGDGQLRLEAELAGKGASDVRDLLVKGKESAAAGHPRDAETAFMMACRAAGKLSGSDAILLADAMYRLGSHYAAVEGAAPAGKRDELRDRARTLYATSLEAYRARYGDDHERTRFAEKGLATLGGSAADAKMVAAATPKPQPEPVQAPAKPAPEAKKEKAAAPPPVVEAPKPAPAVVVAPKPVPPAPAPVAKAPEPKPAPVTAPPVAQRPQPAAEPRREAVAANNRRARPSFDCDKARSTTEKIICADEDLARQDRELGRLHARAKAAAADPRDFQRRSDAAWSSREASCADRACLQRWYSQRRAELSNEAAAPAPRRESVAARETVRPRVQPERAEPVRRSVPAVVAAPRPTPAIVAPSVAAGEASIGQATGDAGDTSQ